MLHDIVESAGVVSKTHPQVRSATSLLSVSESKSAQRCLRGFMLTIALADDHVVVRQGLRLLLESDRNLW